MENNFNHDELKQTLRRRVFSEPSGENIRSDLVRYITILVMEARNLPEDCLLGDDGHDIAMDICGAFAFQGADGVEGVDWITETNEPVLFNLLNISSRLDADANDMSLWRSLFDAARALE